MGKSKMSLLQGLGSDEERRGMQPALRCSWLWRHSSENTFCKDPISVHNSEDAHKGFRIHLFPIESTHRKRPDLLRPTQCSGPSHWIQCMVLNWSGLWVKVSSSMQCTTLKHEGITRKIINSSKTGRGKNYARCAQKSLGGEAFLQLFLLPLHSII